MLGGCGGEHCRVLSSVCNCSAPGDACQQLQFWQGATALPRPILAAFSDLIREFVGSLWALVAQSEDSGKDKYLNCPLFAANSTAFGLHWNFSNSLKSSRDLLFLKLHYLAEVGSISLQDKAVCAVFKLFWVSVSKHWMDWASWQSGKSASSFQIRAEVTHYHEYSLLTKSCMQEFTCKVL